MILEPGDKVLIVHRRLFEEDHARYFIGAIDAYENGVARVTGHSWVRDPFVAIPIRKEGLRTKICPLGSGTLIVYALGADVDLKALRFEEDQGMRLFLTDGSKAKLDLSEGVHVRPAKKF